VTFYGITYLEDGADLLSFGIASNGLIFYFVEGAVATTPASSAQSGAWTGDTKPPRRR
jgi:hypothetical protein